MSDCKKCADVREEPKPEAVPRYFYELEQARSERHIKRLWIALVIAVALIVACNMAWLYAWMQYDYESYEVTADGNSNANYIGQDGDIYNNGSPSESAETHTEEQQSAGEENP
jgi:hypothetical protein